MSSGFQAAAASAGLFASNFSAERLLFQTAPCFFGPQSSGDSNNSDRPRIKLKRTRQRVDAGEPRNTYNGIPSYTPGRPGPLTFGQLSPASMSSAPGFMLPAPFKASSGSPADPESESAVQQQQYFRAAYENPAAYTGTIPNYWNNSYMHHFIRMHQQNQMSQQPAPVMDVSLNNNSEKTKTPEAKVESEDEAEDKSSNVDEEEEPEPKKVRLDEPERSGSPVEHSDTTTGDGGTPKSKRKQYQPQQLDLAAEDDELLMERELSEFDEDLDSEGNEESLCDEDEQRRPGEGDKTAISKMQNEIFDMQQRYVEAVAAQQKRLMCPEPLTTKEPTEEPKVEVPVVKPVEEPKKSPGCGKDLKSLAQTLKSELINSVSTTVDRIVGQFLKAEAERLAAAAAAQQQQLAVDQNRAGAFPGFVRSQAPRPPFYIPPFYYNQPPLNLTFGGAAAPPINGHSIFPPFGGGNANYFAANFGNTAVAPPVVKSGDDPQRKKRSKVTDSRLGKLATRQEDTNPGTDSSPATFGYPTMVPHQMFSSHAYSLDDSDIGANSPDNSDGTGSEAAPYDPNTPTSTTLTPMHLRKAKLMFFYTRYPSSALLKAFFPDIRFNKNNTAQLVKWFSNFREFYYIQMEKYARQALAEGVRSCDEIQVCVDSELYKVLNLHYNRNNHIQVPPTFRRVIESTLREFFTAIQTNRDAEPSWKKSIYKVIARMDEPIPEYFKTPNFLEQLE